MKRHHGISLASAALGALTFSLGISLVACGSDSSSSNDDNKDSSSIVEYGTLDEMVHCTKSHYGEIAHVAETDSIYECTSEGWVVADSSRIEELLSSSDSKSDDEKSSSSIAVSAGDTAKVEIVEVESVTALGFAEKGPFAKGSVVNVRGLDSALNKTRTSFKGAVNDEKGNYSVSKINLSSQYAMVEVNGFFNNEVTGKVTAGTRTKLRALVDLSEGDTVKANVNVLTDLEYERAVALVKNGKYNVPAAKIRATKEILSAFGVTADSVTATKLSFAGKGAATNGLLAASVALMGNLSLSKFQTRLGDVAKSFAETGSIDDTLRAEIADGLSLLDSNGTLATIMKNIEALNSKATGVDSLLYVFWSDNYKLPACDAKTEETIAKNDNKLSSYYGSGYACTNNRWHKSTALDAELGYCTAKNAGRFGKFNSQDYHCDGKAWTEITALEAELGLCADSTSVKWKQSSAGDYYNCAANAWTEVAKDEYNFQKLCTSGNNGAVEKDGDNVYVCDGDDWRPLDDIENKFGYCEPSIKDSVIWTGKFLGKVPDPDDTEGQFLVCNGSKWVDSKRADFLYGVCNESMQGAYKDVNSFLYENPGDTAFRWPEDCEAVTLCKNMKRIYYGDRTDLVYAKCENGEWIPSSYADVFMYRKKEACTDADEGRIASYTKETFACIQGKWYEAIKDSRDDKIYRITKIGNQTWMAENLNYDPGDVSSMGSYAWSGCYGDGGYDNSSGKNLTDEEVAANCDLYGRLYTWEVAMDNANCAYGKRCDASLNPTTPVQGICPEGWHLPSYHEFEELINHIDPEFKLGNTTDASSSTAGQYLKSKSGWNGTDAYGFSALPGGRRVDGGDFYYEGYGTYFWSSGEYDSYYAFYLYLLDDYEDANLRGYRKSYARSVRCLKN